MDGAEQTQCNEPPAKRLCVMFVDDEPKVLAGLKLLLRAQRNTWDMLFTNGAKEALALMSSQPVDVVVTDMCMPVTDGAALLEQVKALSPRTVRIVLSGQTEPEEIMRTVFVAHQFLAKPCSPENLRLMVSRLLAHHLTVQDTDVKAALGGIGQLPSAPSSLLALTAAMARPNSSTQDIANVIQADPSLCAKMLQLVNSSFFGLARRVATVNEAVSMLGLANVRGIALAVGAARVFDSSSARHKRLLEDIRQHSEATATVAAAIAKKEGLPSLEAYTLGILHDLGHVIVLTMNESTNVVITPELAGAYMLSVWGLPLTIGEAVANHQTPQHIEHTGLELVDVIHAANHLASAFAPNPRDPAPAVDLDYLKNQGVTAERYKEWVQISRDVLGPGKCG